MRLLTLALIIVAFGLLAPRGECLRPSPNAKTPEEASSKVNEELTQLIREREMAKREADKRISDKKKAAAERADTVQVRVHAGGINPLSKKKEVIMTAQISKEDLKSKNFTEIHRRARESRVVYAQSKDPSDTEKSQSSLSEDDLESETDNSNAALLLLAALGLGGLWYAKQQSAA